VRRAELEFGTQSGCSLVYGEGDVAQEAQRPAAGNPKVAGGFELG
jgi:hypothetical protein